MVLIQTLARGNGKQQLLSVIVRQPQRWLQIVTNLLRQHRGVMVVAKDSKHQLEVKQVILETSGISEDDIFVLGPGDSILLDDESVADGSVPDFKVVIVPIKESGRIHVDSTLYNGHLSLPV